jgi:hypothetical protein
LTNKFYQNLIFLKKKTWFVELVFASGQSEARPGLKDSPPATRWPPLEFFDPTICIFAYVQTAKASLSCNMRKYADMTIAPSSVLEICLRCSFVWQKYKATGKKSPEDDFLQKNFPAGVQT